MNDHILNLINQILCYSDGVVTDNPHQRAFDHRLRFEAIPAKNPSSDAKTLAPGESFSIFENEISTSLSGASTVAIDFVGQDKSVYRLSVSAGPSGFRTARSVTGVNTCNVTINNQAVAIFDFVGATLSAVQVGDIMRIKGDGTYDTGPHAFNPINSGFWKVIGVSGTKVYAIREIGKAFEAVQESIAASVAADVQFFADDGVRPGMKFQIRDTFSPVSQRTYEVQSSTPDTIDFVSTAAIPEEDNLTYVPGSIVVYTGVKRIIYVEADQECSVKFNGSTDESSRITPIKQNDRFLRGFMTKVGEAYSCTITNKSVVSCRIKFFTAE